jgi:hypothetical protein
MQIVEKAGVAVLGWNPARSPVALTEDVLSFRQRLQSELLISISIGYYHFLQDPLQFIM